MNFSFVSLNIEDGINATDEYDVKSFLADVIYCYVFEASYDDDAVAFLNDIVAEEGYSKGWESIKDFRDYLLSESIWDGHWSDPGFSDEEYSELFDKYKDKILKNLTGL